MSDFTAVLGLFKTRRMSPDRDHQYSSLSFIHSGYFYSASSSPLLLRGAPDTARIPVLCQSFMPKRHRQLRGKDFPKVPTWRLKWNWNPSPFGRKAPNLPTSHHAP